VGMSTRSCSCYCLPLEFPLVVNIVQYLKAVLAGARWLREMRAAAGARRDSRDWLPSGGPDGSGRSGRISPRLADGSRRRRRRPTNRRQNRQALAARRGRGGGGGFPQSSTYRNPPPTAIHHRSHHLASIETSYACNLSLFRDFAGGAPYTQRATARTRGVASPNE